MEVELHDGTILEMPDGTTPAQAQAAAAKYLASLKTGSGGANAHGAGGNPAPGGHAPVEGFIDDLNNSSGLHLGERFRLGLANSGIESYLGAKQLFGKLSPEELQVLAMSRHDAEHGGGAATLGRITGGVSQAVAAGMMAPGVLTATLAKLGPMAGPVTSALASGGQAAVLTPVEDQEHIASGKAKEGAKAAVLGGVLNATMNGISKGLTGMFKPSQEAQQLMDQGITPTLQQGAANPGARLIGGLTSGTVKVKDRQEQELLDALTSRATMGKVDAKGATLAQRLGMIEDSISKDYDAVLKGKKFPMNNSIRDQVMDQATQIEKSGGRFAAERQSAEDALRNIIGTDRNATMMSPDTLRKNYLNSIQNLIGKEDNPMVRKALTNAKSIIEANSQNARLTQAERDALDQVKSQYFDLSRLKEAAAGAQRNEAGVPIRDIAEKYAHATSMDKINQNSTNEQLVGPAVRVLGSTPRQDEARTFLVNAKRALMLGAGGAAVAQPMTAAVTAPLYGISLMGQTAGGAKALFGQYPAQQALKKALESPMDDNILANVLRGLRDNSGGMGAALTQGEGNVP